MPFVLLLNDRQRGVWDVHQTARKKFDGPFVFFFFLVKKCLPVKRDF